jgi:hypothetical protein
MKPDCILILLFLYGVTSNEMSEVIIDFSVTQIRVESILKIIIQVIKHRARIQRCIFHILTSGDVTDSIDFDSFKGGTLYDNERFSKIKCKTRGDIRMLRGEENRIYIALISLKGQ